MAHSYSLGLVALFALAASFSLGGCGSDDRPPGSMVSAGGDSSFGGSGAASGAGVSGKGEAGEAPEAGSSNAGDGGAAGDIQLGTPPTPLAVYPSTFDADVGCGTTPNASLLIRNAGGEALTLLSANADSGFVLKTTLPLRIEPGAAAELIVTPPAAPANAELGSTHDGNLSFRTNEPGMPEHQVALSSKLFGAQLEFTDHDGVPLTSALTLTYLSDSTCPDTVKYRVHNKGNVAFTLFGPVFPVNFGGTVTGASGQSIAPDDYLELMVGGVSAPGGVCGASGQLAFTTKGSFCGAPPSLNVVWPATADATCTCNAAP